MNVDNIKAIKYLTLANQFYLTEGNFLSVATVNVLLAETSIKEKQNIDAIGYYKKVYDFYIKEQSLNTGAFYLLKVAYLLIECDKHEEANKNLKLTYYYYNKNKLTSFKCLKLLFDIGIIYLYLKDTMQCRNWLLLCTEYKKTI